jgi:hypothetical protein
MKKISRLDQPIQVLTGIAIAITGMSTPAIANLNSPTSPGNLTLAQASLVGQCRAAKKQIPVFTQADTTSEAIRLLSTDDRVTLGGNVDVNGFISISEPVSGYVQAINLKPCGSTSVTPPTKELCRQVIRPTQGLLIRREPTTTSAQVGSVAYLGRVTLTTSPATTRKVNNRDWVEISAPVRGWVSNGLDTQPYSNLAFCP